MIHLKDQRGKETRESLWGRIDTLRGRIKTMEAESKAKLPPNYVHGSTTARIRELEALLREMLPWVPEGIKARVNLVLRDK